MVSPPPTFCESSGGLIVTFKAPIGPSGDVRRKTKAESGAESGAESRAVTLLDQIQIILRAGPLSKAEIAAKLGKKKVTGALNRSIRALLEHGIIKLTIPDKPNSRLQKYRLTGRGQEKAVEVKGFVQE